MLVCVCMCVCGGVVSMRASGLFVFNGSKRSQDTEVGLLGEGEKKNKKQKGCVRKKCLWPFEQETEIKQNKHKESH